MKLWHVLLVVVVLALVLGGGVVVVRKISETEASRRLKLEPDVRDRVDRIRAELAAEGIETVIGSTRRDEVEQAAKVAAGLSATKTSWHLAGRALELYVAKRDSKGKLQADVKGTEVAKYKRLHQVAAKHGGRGIPNGAPFDKAGAKAYITTSAGKIWDVAHVEFPGSFKNAAAAIAATSGKKVA